MKHSVTGECPYCHQLLSVAHHDLIEWFVGHVQTLYPTAHISTSYRGQKDQELAFSQGKSHVHFPDSKHNKTPAMALDLFQIDLDGKANWDVQWLKDLNKYNKANFIALRWGGTFSFKDYGHFEVDT